MEKFNPDDLKPFDKILVRLNNEDIWEPQLFARFTYSRRYTRYVACIGDNNQGKYKQAIPYNEETKDLIFTDKNAPEHYDYWTDEYYYED